MQIKKINNFFLKSILPKREKHKNKNDFGKVLIIAGSKGMTGAAYLSCISALKAGAGLVYLAIIESERHIIASMLPELITIPVKSKKGFFTEESFQDIKKITKNLKFDLLLIGPGLGRESDDFVFKVISFFNLPTIIDADALNSFSYNKEKINILKDFPVILTPHEGELKRFIGNFKNKEDTILKLQKFKNFTFILKGYETVILNDKNILKNNCGGPVLAKAGTGDVLSGIIAGIWAQKGKENNFKDEAFNSAVLSVWLHAKSGDLAEKDLTDKCLLASEIMKYLPLAFKEIIK